MSRFHGRRFGRRGLVVVPLAMLAAACSATGGGSIPSQIPLSANDRATFGFTIESLDPDPDTGAGLVGSDPAQFSPVSGAVAAADTLIVS